MRRDDTEAIERAMNWFRGATPESQYKALRALFEHAIGSDWVAVRDAEEALELAMEAGDSPVRYWTPYFTTCGEPIDKW